MKSRKASTAQVVISIFGCLTLFCAAGQVNGSEPAFITGIQVAPDLGHISVRYSGDLGRHAAFVIANPRRLVVDFEGTGVARIPARMAVDRPPIREVRIGHDNARARLVVDFGNDPVPPFTVERQSGRVLVIFGERPPQRAALQGRPSEAARSGGPAPKPAPQLRVEARKPSVSPMSVKNASTTGDLVLVELAHREQPGKTFRLVVDLDHQTMQLRKATVSGNGGVMKRYDIREATSEDGVEVSSAAPKSTSGPKKNVDDPNRPPGQRVKFKWGTQTNAGDAPQPQAPGKGLLRVEKFKL